MTESLNQHKGHPVHASHVGPSAGWRYYCVCFTFGSQVVATKEQAASLLEEHIRSKIERARLPVLVARPEASSCRRTVRMRRAGAVIEMEVVGDGVVRQLAADGWHMAYEDPA